jgi:hypothetical protein
MNASKAVRCEVCTEWKDDATKHSSSGIGSYDTMVLPCMHVREQSCLSALLHLPYAQPFASSGGGSSIHSLYHMDV